MSNSEKYISWLQNKIHALTPYIIYSFVFGSVAKHSSSPGDCDLLIVTSSFPDTKGWDYIRKAKNDLCKSFQGEFDICLSAILLTKDEYSEDIPFLKRILRRPHIDIYGFNLETINSNSKNTLS